ncbi:hypothetical protein [Membranihabitans maritimus]|nr:hypothetical protein [Membranihabitans maritimus]
MKDVIILLKTMLYEASTIYQIYDLTGSCKGDDIEFPIFEERHYFWQNR